jgi:2-haloacid dehalogenase
MAGPAVYVFDAYGTLFDVHSAVARLADRIGPAGERLSALWRSKQLEYSWVRSLMRRHADFWRLTEDALDYAMTAVGGVDPQLRQPLLDAYRTLDAYPEVPSVLRELKQRGARLAILSNGSPDMLAAATASADLDGLLDAVLSVEAAATFSSRTPASIGLCSTASGSRRGRFPSSPRMPGTSRAPRPSASPPSGLTGRPSRGNTPTSARSARPAT